MAVTEFDFVGRALDVADESALYCMIWKNVLELLFPDRILIAASRFANSVFAAG